LTLLLILTILRLFGYLQNRDAPRGERGWHRIAQDEKSSVVYGMPKAAVQLNAAVEVLPPEVIGDRLVQRVLFK
jgi:hypothetical protein